MLPCCSSVQHSCARMKRHDHSWFTTEWGFHLSACGWVGGWVWSSPAGREMRACCARPAASAQLIAADSAPSKLPWCPATGRCMRLGHEGWGKTPCAAPAPRPQIGTHRAVRSSHAFLLPWIASRTLVSHSSCSPGARSSGGKGCMWGRRAQQWATSQWAKSHTQAHHRRQDKPPSPALFLLLPGPTHLITRPGHECRVQDGAPVHDQQLVLQGHLQWHGGGACGTPLLAWRWHGGGACETPLLACGAPPPMIADVLL